MHPPIFRPSPSGEPLSESAIRSRNAFRVTLIALIGIMLTALLSFYAGVRLGTWQHFGLVALLLVYAVVAARSAYLCWHGQYATGIELLIAASLAFMPGSIVLVTDIGLVLGLIVLSVTLVGAGHTLPPARSRASVGATVLMAIVLVPLNNYWPTHPEPHVPPELVSVLPLAVITAALVLALLTIQQFSSYSLRTKLIVAFLCITLIPLVVQGLLAERTARTLVVQGVGRSLKAVTETQAQAVGAALARRVDLLETLSRDQGLQSAATTSNRSYSGTPAEIQSGIAALDAQWQAALAAGRGDDPLVRSRLDGATAAALRAYHEELDEHADIVLTDRYGALVGATYQTARYGQADAAWWQAAFDQGSGAVYIGQLEPELAGGTPNGVIAVPMYAPGSGEVIGVLRTSYDLAMLGKALAATPLQDIGQADLYLAGGWRLSAQDGQTVPVDPGMLADLASKAPAGYAEMDYRGVYSLISVASVTAATPGPAAAVRDLGWVLAVHRSITDPDPQGTLIDRLLYGGMLTAAVAGVAAIAASQVLAGPITRLTAVAETVARDDLTAQARVETQDEIGTLARVFNAMVARLRQTLGGLEQRVAERTAQLEAANAELQSEIAERRRAEERLTDSLREKEVLLREIHHRVKNNLQIISSLLNLELAPESAEIHATRAPLASDILLDSQNRIRSMVLVHEKLYRSPDLAQIDFGEYVPELVAHLFHAYERRPAAIALTVHAEDVWLGVDTAIPCGLIINELVSNSLKHAFPAGRAGEIRVEMQRAPADRLVLTVADDGVGFPPDVDFRSTPSLGLQLVNTLVAQLEATIMLDQSRGTRFTIDFPEPQRST